VGNIVRKKRKISIQEKHLVLLIEKEKCTMADIDILLQGLREDNDHETAINTLLSLPDMDRFVLSVAFLRKSGVDDISEKLDRVSSKVDFFVGIRNGITSVQGILSLLKIGIKPYVVDTASNSKIFHPKIYAGYSTNYAHVILGSANLTSGGLNRNIEASSIVKLNRTCENDEKFVRGLIDTIMATPEKYPDHVFRISSAKEAGRLLKESRLEDERISRLPISNSTSINKKRDKLTPMSTYTKKRQKPHVGIPKKKMTSQPNKAILVWESNPLTERSLNIPSGTNTNITGDTNLGKGLMKDIDFQHYFRDIVFSELKWEVDQNSRNKYLERAHIATELIIKNYSYGNFTLEVTHDPRTDTESYLQRNVMTKIKWGKARPLIAKEDLLNRTLKLYKKDGHNFVIVID
jgi:HKD family nuclease